MEKIFENIEQNNSSLSSLETKFDVIPGAICCCCTSSSSSC